MSDPIWFYVDRSQRRHGPVTAAAVAAAFRSGEADDESLVWRDGLAAWTPLAVHRGDFGLVGEAPAPRPATAYGAPAPLPPPAKRMSGCLIVGLVLVVLAVPMLAIVAAIALPAYQDYVIRSQAEAALADIRVVPSAVETYLADNGRCPATPADLGLADRVQHDAGRSTEIALDAVDAGRCRITAAIVGGNPKLSGVTIDLTRTPEGDWRCTATLAPRYLPTGCDAD